MEQKNTNGIWFKQKTYGYGLTPANASGWVATGIFLIVILLWVWVCGFWGDDVSGKNVASLLTGLVVIVVVFLQIATKRASGKMKWRWGNEK